MSKVKFLTEVDTQDLKHGLYKLYWNSGGFSLASVGSDPAGNRWFSACNWTSGESYNWSQVVEVTLIKLDNGED